MPLAVRCLLAALLGFAALGASHAGEVAERVKSSGQLRVCIWPVYYGVTFRSPRTQALSGIDIDLSAALAKDLNAKLQYVDTTIVSFLQDIQQDRCDIGMFAIGVSPRRQEAVAFSQPYLQTDIYAVTTHSSRSVRNWADIDKPGVRVAVQAGTFMEPIVSAWIKRAELVIIKPPQLREQELEAGRIDVFMTDYAYSRRVLDVVDWARLLAPPAPFHLMPYAYAVKHGDAEWLQRVNQFVAAIKKDGRLKQAAEKAGLAEMLLPTR
jgi:cyclohexadienyl dehydratase